MMVETGLHPGCQIAQYEQRLSASLWAGATAGACTPGAAAADRVSSVKGAHGRREERSARVRIQILSPRFYSMPHKHRVPP